MLLINARAGVSKIHGIGLIAQEFIPKGLCVWRFQPGFDLVLGEEQLQLLSAPARQQVCYYAFYDSEKQVYVLSGDDDRFPITPTNRIHRTHVRGTGILKPPPSATSGQAKRSPGIIEAG